MAILVTGNTFADGDQVTSTKLNNIANAATFASGAVDGATTTLTAGGAIQVGTIQLGNIASNAVTTAKIADATDTSTGVTNTKLRWSAATSVIGRSAASSGAPADIAASANDQVLRMSSGTIGFGTITPSSLTQWMTQGTAVTSTSGTSVNFTGIPDWVKRITVFLNGVSLSGTALLRFRLGISSGFVTTGYSSNGSMVSAIGNVFASQTAGFDVYDTASVTGDTYTGRIVFENITGNTWVANGSIANNSSQFYATVGSIALASALTQVQVTSSNGTDTFDAGTINIIYE